MQLSMMQPWPIGPWAQGWLSASTCVPSRKTAMRSPPGIATIRQKKPIARLSQKSPVAPKMFTLSNGRKLVAEMDITPGSPIPWRP